MTPDDERAPWCPWRTGYAVATPRFQLADRRTFTVKEALRVTAASALLPGIAHLRAGRRRAGAAIAAGWAAVSATAAGVVTATRDRTLSPDAITLGSAAVAAAWVLLLISSYRAVRPRRLSTPGRAAAGAAVMAACALAATPPLLLARHHPRSGVTAHGGTTGDGRRAPGPAAQAPTAGQGPLTPSWNGPRLLTILLLSGDGGTGREPRAGTLTIARLDTRTGDAVLLSLPGALRRLPVAGVPAGEPLGSLYAYGLAHPRLTGRHARDPGAELLKRAVARIVGSRVDYYGETGARGVASIAGAVRGACSGAPVPAAAREAGAGRRQAGVTPATDVPRRLLPGLAALSAKVRTAHVRSLRFGPPLISPRRPDYAYIRVLAARTLDAGRPREDSGGRPLPPPGPATPTGESRPVRSCR